MNFLDQLYKTKLRLAGLVTAVVGVALLFLAKHVEGAQTLSWLVGWPTKELGTTFLGLGVFGLIFEYYARKEADERATEHFRKALRQEAPALVDAVLDSFAASPDRLKNIASDETLDRIAANTIGLRVDDPELAAEAYADLREQVIRTPERWRDVDISVSLSPWEGGPAQGRGSMFVATVRWEYQVRPATPTMRFVCLSEEAEYRELRRDPTLAGRWYFDTSASLDAADPEVFALVQLSVDGKAKKIRRSTRPGSQQATVSLGQDAVGREVTISYTYRVLVQRHGHLLYLDIPRPTKGVHIKLDYAHAGIRRVNVIDYFASPAATRVETSPASTPTKTVDVSFDRWVFPRAGVAFVWVLTDEIQGDGSPAIRAD